MNGHLRTLTLYLLSGVCSNAAGYGLFVLLLVLSVPPLVASALCYGLAVALSYVLNRHLAFKSAAGHRHDLPRFLIAYGVGLAVTLTTLQITLAFMHPAIGQLVAMGVAAMTIYSTLWLTGFGRAPGRRLSP